MGMIWRRFKHLWNHDKSSLERFRAKWTPVRVKKTRQNKRLEPRSDSSRTEKVLVANGDAGDVGAPQGPARRLGLIAFKAGEAGAEQFAIAFGDHRFGERIGLAKQSVGLIARRFDALLGFAFALQRANLN